MIISQGASETRTKSPYFGRFLAIGTGYLNAKPNPDTEMSGIKMTLDFGSPLYSNVQYRGYLNKEQVKYSGFKPPSVSQINTNPVNFTFYTG